MPVYVYETTDPTKRRRRFELQQSIRDEALKTDPKTGEPVRRVISGGIGVQVSRKSPPSPPSSCRPGCGCH